MNPLGGPVRELRSLDRLAYEQHLLALGPEDRRLRFGTPVADSVVRAYVARIGDQVCGVSAYLLKNPEEPTQCGACNEAP